MTRVCHIFNGVGVTTTPLSVIVMTGVANHTFKLARFHIYGLGSDPSKQMMKVEICRCSADEVGTGITEQTKSGDSSVTPQITSTQDAGTEPTTVTPIEQVGCHQAGSYTWEAPLDSNMFESAVGAAMCLRVTSPDGQTVSGTCETIG